MIRLFINIFSLLKEKLSKKVRLLLRTHFEQNYFKNTVILGEYSNIPGKQVIFNNMK